MINFNIIFNFICYIIERLIGVIILFSLAWIPFVIFMIVWESFQVSVTFDYRTGKKNWFQ